VDGWGNRSLVHSRVRLPASSGRNDTVVSDWATSATGRLEIRSARSSDPKRMFSRVHHIGRSHLGDVMVGHSVSALRA